MPRSLIIKIILAISFILALVLGLLQHSQEKYVYDFHNVITASDAGIDSYYHKAENIRGLQMPQETATFFAAGDIMLSRNVALAIQKSENDSYAFQGMADVLKSTDFNFANLETPIAQNGGIIGGHSLVFNSPKAYADKLKDYNFQIVNLANNHAFDQGLKGLENTASFLDTIGILYEGTGKNLEEAWQPAVVEANGIKICFVGASYASINDNGKTTNNYVARMEDTVRLKSAIEKSKAACNFTVATMHGGVEYTRNPNQAQVNFAHAAIDDGADIVIGAHPHWVQTTEKYNGHWIFYSLGNFIFDQDFSQDTQEGLGLKIKISKDPGSPLQGPSLPAKIESVELLPVIITNSQPRPATANESQKILQKIGLTENILK